MKVPGWIITAAISILTAAVLELNKNTLPGWILFVIALAGMTVISRKYMGAWSWWKKALGIAAYLAVCVGIVFITWPPVKRVPAADTANPPRTEVYSTAYGDVRGVVLDSGVELFAGIPYAAPPVDELRWKKPQDPEPWENVLECDTFAPMSMQVQNLPVYNSLAQIIGYHDYQISLKDNYREANSEDSLYQNGTVYYMNGKNGTEFDWHVNDRLSDFMVFYNDEDKLGAVKASLYCDGGLLIYIYGDQGKSVRQEIRDLYFDVTEEEMLKLAVRLRTAADDKRIWDAAIRGIDTDTEPDSSEVEEFVSNDHYYGAIRRRKDLLRKNAYVSRKIADEGWIVGYRDFLFRPQRRPEVFS